MSSIRLKIAVVVALYLSLGLSMLLDKLTSVVFLVTSGTPVVAPSWEQR